MFVPTTFHDDESREEVAKFFKVVASASTTSALVVSENPDRWRAELMA